MRATTTLTDGAGNTLFVQVSNATPPMPAERHHTWVSMMISGRMDDGMHEWHDDEFKAQLRVEQLVKDAVAMGWVLQPTMSVPSP